jgi:hypothetical protein
MICQVQAGCGNEARHVFERADSWSITLYSLCEAHFNQWVASRQAPSLEAFWETWKRPATPEETFRKLWGCS